MADFTPSVLVVMAVLTAAVAGLLVFVRVSKRNYFRWDECMSRSLTASNFISSRNLAITRCFTALYTLAILVYSVATNSFRCFTFYTFWNFTLLTVYFWCAAFNSVYALMPRSAYCDMVEGSSFSRIYVLARVMWVLFQVCSTMVVLVDVVLWGILFPNTSGSDRSVDLTFDSFNVHGANFVFMMFELFMSRIQFTPPHFIFVVILPMLYGYYQWIYRAFGGGWMYPFMDTTVNTAGLWYLGLMVAHIAFFFLVYTLTLFRNYLARRCGSTTVAVGFGSDADDHDGDDQRLLMV
eukprot:m.499489 g.499489  ORF g.499489 m.499489 type:complete len:294 (-) comp57323_c2_seq2:605-1486(-)